MNKLSVLLLVVAVAGVSAININKLRSKTKGPDGSGCVALGGSCNTACDNGHWVRGLCPGAPVCCVPGAAPATAASAAPSTPAPSAAPGSGGKVCLTFDDGPFPITNDILQMLSQEGVKGTWFMNCHSGTDATVKRMAADGHLLANHMCSHDIMAAAHYKANYGAEMSQKNPPVGCLTTAAQQNVFKQNVQGTIDMYKAMFGGNLPPRAFQLHRFPGDGRFMQCLVAKLQDPSLVNVPGIHHLGWTYEIAPEGTFGHVKSDSGVAGLAAAEPRKLRNGDVVLAHDLHYRNGKLAMLQQWIKNAKAAGFTFALPQPDGKCL